MNDVDRLLLFEWHATHFESLDEWLPPVPRSIQWIKGMSTENFHAVSIRSAILRKFFAKSEKIELVKVWRSLLALADDDRGANYQDSVEYLIERKDDLLRHSVQYHLGAEIIDSGDIWDEINYGLLIHGDADRGQNLRALGPAVNNALWNIYGWPTLRFSPADLVTITLGTVRSCRDEKLTRIGLPEPYKPIWSQYEPTMPDRTAQGTPMADNGTV